MSWLFVSDGQSIGASASISVLAMKYLGLISFRIGWFDLLAVQGTQESFPTPQFESICSSVLSILYGPTVKSVHDYGKTVAFRQSFVSKVMSVLFSTLSRFIITFLPRSKHLLISWLQYHL